MLDYNHIRQFYLHQQQSKENEHTSLLQVLSDEKKALTAKIKAYEDAKDASNDDRLRAENDALKDKIVDMQGEIDKLDLQNKNSELASKVEEKYLTQLE